MVMKINKEICNLIPPLTQDEYNQLEFNIIADGCRDPLIIWDDTLIDGHNRYKICKEHDIKFATIAKQFKNIEEAKIFIIDNQLGRRNISVYCRGELELEKDSLLEIKEQAKQNLKTKSIYVQPLLTLGKAVNTTETLAKKINTSKANATKIIKIKEHATPEQKEKLRTGEESINKVYKEIRQTENEILNTERLNNLKANPSANTGNVKLLEGDFFDRINDVENRSIDVLLSDPPYFILGDEWDKFKNIEDFKKFTFNWLDKCFEKMKSTGRAYIFFGHERQYLLYNILKENNFFGFNLGNTIIWVKRNNNKPSDRKKYRLMYEPLFYLYGVDSKELNFTPDTFCEMSSDVWEIATPQSNYKDGKFHPAQKPLQLYENIIKTSSKENDVVLDPFAGSGTTGIICNKLNRKSILIERDKEYIEIIKGRI